MEIYKTSIIVMISFASLLVSQAIHAEDNSGKAKEPTELKVLRFGSSNTQGVGDLSRLAKGTKKCQFKKNKRWYTLSFKGLWEDIQIDEKNNGKSFRKHSNKGLGTVLDNLQEEKWDVIILSSHMLTASIYYNFKSIPQEVRDEEREALPKCIAYIKKHAPQARLFYFNTYAISCSYDELEVPLRKKIVEGFIGKERESTENLFEYFLSDTKVDVQRCQDICKEFSLKMIPVRQALCLAHADPVWGYIYTPLNVKEIIKPQLPIYYFRPYLHIGWRWNKPKKGEPELKFDGHAEKTGRYLIACVTYQALTGKSAIGLKKANKVSVENCTILREIAEKTMEIKDNSPQEFIDEYVSMRKKKLENKQKGVYKLTK